MPKHDISKTLAGIRNTLKRHMPDVLTITGIIGMATTVILAAKATPKALALIEGREIELRTDALAPIETVKAVWRCYISAAGIFVLSAICFLEANNLHWRRYTALSILYSLSESTIKDYRAKVREMAGERKECAICDSVAKEQILRDPVSKFPCRKRRRHK